VHASIVSHVLEKREKICKGRKRTINEIDLVMSNHLSEIQFSSRICMLLLPTKHAPESKTSLATFKKKICAL
jgi:hypothetical protein